MTPNSFNITNITTTKLENPRFVQPLRINYTQNGSNKTWEAVKSHDSVSILLYHKTKNAFLVVKQFRPPVYVHNNDYPFTYELCAGIVDKDISLIQIAQEEIDEECGYKVEIDNISKINSFFTNVGVSGAKQHLYFATIDESMKVHEGGGINDEQIELEFISIEESKKFIFDETKAKTPGLIFSFYWFYDNY
jgi:UDP-sugar diphosphatase